MTDLEVTNLIDWIVLKDLTPDAREEAIRSSRSGWRTAALETALKNYFGRWLRVRREQLPVDWGRGE